MQYASFPDSSQRGLDFEWFLDFYDSWIEWIGLLGSRLLCRRLRSPLLLRFHAYQWRVPSVAGRTYLSYLNTNQTQKTSRNCHV
jgi:hypothetical protein